MRAELSANRRYVQVETGWFLAYLGRVQVVYMDGRVDDASYDRYLRALAADIDDRAARDEPAAILYHVPQPAALTAKRRNLLAEILREREDAVRRNTIAYALATTSALVRGGLKILFWLAPPPYPNTVVPTPRAGFEFLSSFSPDLNVTQLAADYELLLRGHAVQLGAP